MHNQNAMQSLAATEIVTIEKWNGPKREYHTLRSKFGCALHLCEQGNQHLHLYRWQYENAFSNVHAERKSVDRRSHKTHICVCVRCVMCAGVYTSLSHRFRFRFGSYCVRFCQWQNALFCQNIPRALSDCVTIRHIEHSIVFLLRSFHASRFC